MPLSPAVSANPSLRALTAAALALPGLAHTTAHATEGDEATLQYGRHEEGARDLFGVESAFDPIQVDSLHGAAKVTIFDRLKFAFNYLQDTWSGATPIATAPLIWGGNASPDGVSGATPFISPSGNIFFDSQFNPVTVDEFGQISGKNAQLVHTLSSASPETRRQGDFRLSYEWDEAMLELGGGISLENDYESHWGSLGGRWDLNQKLTSLVLGLSYTESDTEAIIDHDASPYIDKSAFRQQIEVLPFGVNVLRGKRKDWASHLSLTQILNKNALLEAGFGYTRSTGFMENPYKVVEVAFIDPNQQFLAPPGGFAGQVRALLEQRPDVRNQWTWDARYARYIEGLDAALHFSYRFFHDDWGINAHTFEAVWGQPVGHGWTITPRIRYYSQDAADFYRPFLISRQAPSRVVCDAADNCTTVPFDPKKLPADFSSDHRLSGYGSLSGGITVAKEFARGVTLETGFEYYTHQGDLKLAGGGEGDFSDFDYWMVNAALKVDLSAPFNFTGGGHGEHENHGGHAGHSGGHAPAGVMFSHMLPRAGDFMAGYRYMYHRQDGDILHRSGVASDADIIKRGCGDRLCKMKPADHSMHMHMLDLMYAPTDWLNLMLMPQFVDMEMSFEAIDGAPPFDSTEIHHVAHSHSTGGIGDTWMFALGNLWDTPGHHLHASLGLSAPTGEVDLRFRRNHGEDQGFIHYHMQLGSGTWDLLPSLTYTGRMGQWSWGGQLSGVKRLEQENDSGYSLGDMFQATAWGGYNLTDWLTASVRGVYTAQGSINGRFIPTLANVEDEDGNPVIVNKNSRLSPVDLPANYGGRYWDIGFGLTATVPFKGFEGNQVSVEWLHPIEDDVNGFQLEREGTLSVTWSLGL